MRTTLTVEDGLIRQLKGCAQRSGLTFREMVHRTLRAGLEALETPRTRGRYRCPAYSLGKAKGVNLDKALRVAEGLEDQEIVRKLALRK